MTTDAVREPESSGGQGADRARTYELRVLRSLRQVMRAIDLYSRRLAAAHGVTVPQLLCLSAAAAEGPLTVSALSQRVHLSPSTVVGIVDRLEERGLVARQRGSGDRRTVFVSATPAGAEVVAGAPSPLQDQLSARLADLTELEQATIALALERLVELMGAADPAAAPILEPGPLP